mgnify:CR=1 FL=1|jgi:ribonuclease J
MPYSSSVRLEISLIGGVGKFGMNMMAVRTNTTAVLIDAGIGFTPLRPYGISLCIPDVNHLRSEFGSFDALLVTHGHEDHIGSIPFIWNLLEGPVYGTRLTLAFVERRLNERGIAIDDRLIPITTGSFVSIGDLEVEFIPVDHSIPDSTAVVVRSPIGSIVHTGDFKFDQRQPAETDPAVAKLAELGRNGILAMFSDSTNASQPGRTASEQELQPLLEQICNSAPARVFVTTFASSIRRIQLLIDLADKTGRHIVFLGHGIEKNVDLAERLGYINIPPRLRKPPSTLQDPQSKNSLCIVSGSQGEPYAALSRLARNTHNSITIEANDTVIFSARVIPGNELAIDQLKNNLLELGAHVVDNDSQLVHVSGHGSQDDLATMMSLLKPKYLIPIHGQFRELKTHASLAKQAGITALLANNGDRICFNETDCWLGDPFQTQPNYLDDELSIPVENHTLLERRALAKNGVLVVILSINRKSRQIDQHPKLITRGVLTENHGSACIDRLAKAVQRLLNSTLTSESGEPENLMAGVMPDLQRLAKRHFGSAPVVLPILLEN